MSEIMSCGTQEELEAAVARAAEVAGDGECVVLPTDTVYGIGCDAFSAPGVQGLLGAKGRTREMPPPVLIARPEVMDALADEISDDARALARAFWPGALTIVCWARPSLGWDLGETHGTVALRVPDDAVTRAVLERVGPMAVSSANRTGMPAARTAEQAREMLQDRVALYLEAGPRPVREPAAGARDAASTIVDCTGETPVVLRHGAITLQRLREVVPAVHGGGTEDAPAPTEPGADPASAAPGTTGASVPGSGAGNDAAAHADGSAVPASSPAGESGADTADEELITAMVQDAAGSDTASVDQLRDRDGSPEPRWNGTRALSMDEAQLLVAEDRDESASTRAHHELPGEDRPAP